MRKILMKNFLVVGVISIVMLSVACGKSEINIDKELIVIDTNEDKKALEENMIETKVLYKVPIERNFDVNEGFPIIFINDNVFEINTKLNNEELKENEWGSRKIVKARIGEIQEEKDDNDLNKINLKDLKIEGYLISELGVAIENNSKIINEGKVYNLNNDGSLLELDVYEKLNKESLRNILYYKNLYNDKINVLYSGSQEILAIVDIENNMVIDSEDELFEVIEDKYNILDVEEDIIYVWYVEMEEKVDGIKEEDLKQEIKIGYIKDKEYHDIFEDKITIIDQKLKTNLYGDSGKDKVLLHNNKLLFTGIINETNGIWNYDIESKELSLQMELEKDSVANMFLSGDKEKLNIMYYYLESVDDMTIKYSDVMGRLNEDFKLEGLNNFNKDDKEFMYFYEEGNKAIYRSSLNNDVSPIEVYEIHEITN